jgi:tetratricopeptide (TPR) repeat protein
MSKPDKRPVYVAVSEVAGPQSSPDELKRLKWHLEAGGSSDLPKLSLAWARYALSINDLEGARRYLEKAAVQFPELWVTIGDVNLQLGNNELAGASYEKARTYLSEKVSNATGIERRAAGVDYAAVLVRLGRLDDARLVLEEGLKTDPDGAWRQLLADLYVNYHDLLSFQSGHSIGELLEPISKALEYDPNFGPALNRLMAYVEAKVDGNIELRKVLARVVAEGKEPALAHLALGNICWIEQDTTGAVFHFERAISINPKLATVMNNLAWLLAHDDQRPDLNRALGLVDASLSESPDNPDFLDTRGTILMMLDRKKEAVHDLEKAIALKVSDRASVHGKLATLYAELGLADMAEQNKLLESESRIAQQSKSEQRASRKSE